LKTPLISIVTPFFNEGEGIGMFAQRITGVIDAMPQARFEIVCVDDGSWDDTLQKLVALAHRDARFVVVELTRNFGKEAAMTAGIDAATGDAVVPMDADLQDPPELMGDMIKAWQGGADVVLAKRVDREADSVGKRVSASWFYRLHNRISSVHVPENVGDYRLMSRPVVDALKRLPEQQRFMKGLFAWVGFRTTTLEYARPARAAGQTKFSGWKLWNFALEAMTSFSTVPLRAWTYIGLIVAAMAFVYMSLIIARTVFFGIDVPGYASLLVAVLFMGSLQLISVGILGEYIGRIYLESKRRPVYLTRAVHAPLRDDSAAVPHASAFGGQAEGRQPAQAVAAEPGKFQRTD
jgi:polyisoprenyl-phosphate glycosyltransferase